MSNALVGSIYQQIIADVIDTSRVDFEEGGVDESVLDVLRQGWQNKLSQLEIATFPWDPKPEPQVVSNPPTVPSNVGNYQPISQQPQPQMAMGSNNGPRIKSEPGLDSPSLSMQQPSQYSGQIPNLPPTATTAQQRAAAHLHQNYGPRAAASISAIQQGFQQGQQGGTTTTIQQMQQIQIMQQQRAQQQQQQHQQQQQQGMNQGQVQTGQQQLSQQDYQFKQMMAAQTAASQQALSQRTGQTGQSGQNSVSSAQTDGASDTVETTDIIKLFDVNSNDVSVSRVEIDGLIRQKIKAIGSTMEGGGLMLPIYQVGSFSRSPTARRGRKGKGRAQLDGGDDDDDDDVKEEELDEDAINSDLDDPDEGLNEEDDDDEGLGHIMLCMYDKVQRVKNKWKCVMKDGVLTVNKKEYVFHKATGEYEW